MILRCNSCGGTYSPIQRDGLAYYHQCSPEIIEHATFDAAGKQTSPEKRKERTDVRDERIAPGVFYLEGKSHRNVLVPGERAVFTAEPAELKIVSYGKGCEPVG